MKWQSELYNKSLKDRKDYQGLLLPYASKVETISSMSERAIITNWATSGRELNISHPFVSTSSWYRAMPEVGTKYMTTNRSDDSEPQLIGTYQGDSAVRTKSYMERVGVYRPLSSGEQEISTPSMVQSYYSSQTYKMDRAGLIMRYMSHFDLMIMDRSPIHHKQLLNYKVGELGDEYRLGIVSRPINKWKNKYPKLNNKFQAEEYLHIKNPAGSSPAVLYTRQSGSVVELDGTTQNSETTSLPLAYREKFFATDDTFSSMEVDKSGNIAWKLAMAATDGYNIIIPNGSLKYKIEKDFVQDIIGNREQVIQGSDFSTIQGSRKTSIEENYDSTSKNRIVKVKEEMKIDSNTIEVKAVSDIKVNSNSIDITSTSIAKFQGSSMTDVGGSSITNVNGSIVNLGGGGMAVARFGDKAIGTGNLGGPVVSIIIQGSPKVTCG